MPSLIYLASTAKDFPLLNQFIRHLSPLQQAQQIQIWSARDIEAGEDWNQAKAKALQNADLILLLISAHFLSDPFSYEQEIKPAMDFHRSGKAKVIPIILSPCFWRESPFAELSVLPKNTEPVNGDAWKDSDEAFAEIVQEIAQLTIGQKKEKPQASIIEDGQYLDSRDGQQYPVLEFAGNTWMAQNLNFAYVAGYQIYGNEPANAQQYGGLYTWEAAQKACPPGWRLPNDSDWKSLIDFFGNDYLAYKHLQSGGDSPLKMSRAGKWSTHSNQCVLLEECGFYWTSEEVNYEEAIYYMFDDGMAALRRIKVGKKTGASVRCVLVG